MTATPATQQFSMQSLQGRVLLERYLLSEYIAEGNFGAVFRSQQLFLGTPVRRVAVKVSKQTGVTADKAKELFGDVFTLAQAMDEMPDAIARSRLVHVYDAGIAEENRAFIVMEYVGGSTLEKDLARMGRAGVQQLLRWTRQIAEAVAALHRLPRPLVHRDLKPDNILIGEDHAIRVVDFGLTARLNDLGWVAGAAGATTWMAPESMRGRTLAASDIYSIGLIMYQALTGALPFSDLAPPVGMPAEAYDDWLLEQKERIAVAPPSTKNPAVPQKLDRLILKCLAVSPAARPRDGQALLAELDDIERSGESRAEEAALDEGLRLKAAGDLAGAVAAWERGLRAAPTHLPLQAELLRELAMTELTTKGKKAALARWTELWEKVQSSGSVMASSKERIDLLDRIIALQTEVGDHFQASRYREEKRRRFPAAA